MSWAERVALYLISLPLIFAASVAVGFVASWLIDCLECRREVRSRQWHDDVRRRG